MDNAKKQQRIGIIAALPFEIAVLKGALTDGVVKVIGGSEYYLGKIEGCDVVFMQCGMGKVSAAAGAQAMITAFEPDIIINTGCAGALAHELKLGDMVLADKTVEWDLDTIDLGNPRGFVSAMGKVEMETDKSVTDKIAEAIGEDAKLFRGLVVSGDQFVSKDEQRELILTSFPGAMCTEMEGAAIGHVCAQNGVPFCVVRCMSDNADGDSGVSFAEFAPVAGERSAGYILRFLKNLK